MSNICKSTNGNCESTNGNCESTNGNCEFGNRDTIVNGTTGEVFFIIEVCIKGTVPRKSV
jgi:hypothetical protein